MQNQTTKILLTKTVNIHFWILLNIVQTKHVSDQQVCLYFHVVCLYLRVQSYKAFDNNSCFKMNVVTLLGFDFPGDYFFHVKDLDGTDLVFFKLSAKVFVYFSKLLMLEVF